MCSIRKASSVLACLLFEKRVEFKNRKAFSIAVHVAEVIPEILYTVMILLPKKKYSSVGSGLKEICQMNSWGERVVLPTETRHLNMYYLEFRRMMGDLAQTYKILRWQIKIFFTLGKSQRKGRSYKMRGQVFEVAKCTKFLPHSAMKIWYSLAQWMVEVRSLDTLKIEIYK